MLINFFATLSSMTQSASKESAQIWPLTLKTTHTVSSFQSCWLPQAKRLQYPMVLGRWRKGWTAKDSHSRPSQNSSIILYGQKLGKRDQHTFKISANIPVSRAQKRKESGGWPSTLTTGRLYFWTSFGLRGSPCRTAWLGWKVFKL